MKLVHKMAIRNLLRNRRRTLLSSMVIFSTFSLMILFMGLSDGGHKAMIEVGIKMGVGQVVVHHNNYSDDPSLSHLLTQSDQVVNQIQQLASDHQLELNVVKRLRLDALIQSAGQGVAVTVSGVEPDREIMVSSIANQKAIQDGQTLSQPPLANMFLPPVVLGRQLANNLRVQVGDKVTLTVKPQHSGDLARAAFQVQGIFETGMQELDSFWVEVPIEQLQSLAQVGDKVSELALYLNDLNRLPFFVSMLSSKPELVNYEFKPWYRAAPELYSAVTLDAAGMYLLMVIVYVVVAVGVLNTILMSVIRRTREFGVLMAIGAQPSFVVRTVFWEAFYLGLFSSILGLIVGLAGHYHFATEGLNFKEIFGTSFEAGGIVLPEKFYSYLMPVKVLISMLFVVLLTIVVSIYPSWKASKLSPLEATRNHT